MTIKVMRLNRHATLPTYAHETDSGFDLYAAEEVIIHPGETTLVPTGIAIDIPRGFEIQVRPRSGVTRKTKLRVQLGTIDAGYRGDIGIIVDNASNPHNFDDGIIGLVNGNYIFLEDTGEEEVDRNDHDYVYDVPYLVRKGDRIAQGVLAPVAHALFEEVAEFDGDTDRGENGFGSTGVRE